MSSSSADRCSSAASAAVVAAIAAVASSSAATVDFAGPSVVGQLGEDRLLPSASELDRHQTSDRHACGCRPSGHLGCIHGYWDASGPWGDHPESSHVGHRDHQPSLGAATAS